MEALSFLGFISNTIDIALNAPSVKRIKAAQALSAEIETQKNKISLEREELALWNDGIETIKKLNRLIAKDKTNPEARKIWENIKNNVQEKIGLTAISYDDKAQISYKDKSFLDIHS